ncbi:hypothetical protein C0215_19900 [Clostridioides difficile]|nr:hypothetical protein C0215_19900 [Clostridioides difficile]
MESDVNRDGFSSLWEIGTRLPGGRESGNVSNVRVGWVLSMDMCVRGDHACVWVSVCLWRVLRCNRGTLKELVFRCL